MVPASASCPSQFTWAESKGVIGYNDITPRMGVAYDVFGTGKTAVKFNAGKYLEAAVNGNGNYSAAAAQLAHRSDADPRVDRLERQLRRPTAIC